MKDSSLWNQGGRPVVVGMTQQYATALVSEIVEAVTKKTQEDTIEQYRQLVRLQRDLEKANDEIARKNAEIDALRERVASLNNFVTAINTNNTSLAVAAQNGSYPTPPLPLPSNLSTGE